MKVVKSSTDTLWDVALQLGGVEAISSLLNSDTQQTQFEVESLERTDSIRLEQSQAAPARQVTPYQSEHNQTRWDVALQLTGSAEGIADLLTNDVIDGRHVYARPLIRNEFMQGRMESVRPNSNQQETTGTIQVIGDPDINEVWGNPDTNEVWGWE